MTRQKNRDHGTPGPSADLDAHGDPVRRDRRSDKSRPVDDLARTRPRDLDDSPPKKAR